MKRKLEKSVEDSWGSVGKEHELFARVKEFELSTARMIDYFIDKDESDLKVYRIK